MHPNSGRFGSSPGRSHPLCPLWLFCQSGGSPSVHSHACGEAGLVLKVATCSAYLRQGGYTKAGAGAAPTAGVRPPSAPVPLATWSRTLAVSSGKVIASATQAATPAEKSLTAMVGCTSEVVGPIILTRGAERGAGVEGEGLAAPRGAVLSASSPSCGRELHTRSLRRAGGGGRWAGGARERGRAWRRRLLPHARSRSTRCAQARSAALPALRAPLM